MSPPTDSRSPQSSLENSQDSRRISKWARRYAQNRSLGVVVGLVIFLVLVFAIAVPSYFGGSAYRSGQWLLFWGCLAILAAAMVALVCFSMPWWGGKIIDRIVKRLYAGEGTAQVGPACTRRPRWLGGILGATFGTCILAAVVLGLLGFLPERYMQPISAIYTVPFLVGLWLLIRPSAGPIFLLWPALYALHAVLILAGVPILFSGRWGGLNMLIPTAGYGLLTGMVSHLYSRFALRRLRSMARRGLPDPSAEVPQP